MSAGESVSFDSPSPLWSTFNVEKKNELVISSRNSSLNVKKLSWLQAVEILATIS